MLYHQNQHQWPLDQAHGLRNFTLKFSVKVVLYFSLMKTTYADRWLDFGQPCDIDLWVMKWRSEWPIFHGPVILPYILKTIWTASSEFGTYRLCEQRRFRRACASAQSRQNLRCSLIQAVSQEEPSNRKPDPWPLWMAGHAQLIKTCRDRMLEDTNSLDGAHLVYEHHTMGLWVSMTWRVTSKQM